MRLTGLLPASLRFTFSPLQEVLRSLHVLAEPRRHAEQMRWARETRRRLTPRLRRDMARFRPLLSPTAETFPDLLPLRDESFERELNALARAAQPFRDAVLRRMVGKPLVTKRDLDRASDPKHLRALAANTSLHDADAVAFFRAFARSEDNVRAAFCSFVEEYFARCFESAWSAFESRARADIESRARVLERHGIAAMLRTLSRDFTVTGNMQRATLSYVPPALAARGITERPIVDCVSDTELRITPSYFTWPHPTLIVLRNERTLVAVTYPLSAPDMVRTDTSWEAVAQTFGVLADPTRLHLLELLAQRDLSTRECAGLLGISESGASRHLALLRTAGLVSSSRDGYFVLYRRVPEALSDLTERLAQL